MYFETDFKDICLSILYPVLYRLAQVLFEILQVFRLRLNLTFFFAKSKVLPKIGLLYNKLLQVPYIAISYMSLEF